MYSSGFAIFIHVIRSIFGMTTLKKHRIPPNKYIYLHHSSSWQLLTVMQKFALEQNSRVQESRYFVCVFHQVGKST